MEYSHEAAGVVERRHWACPLPAPPGRWAGTWSRIGWGWARAPRPAETAGWWWWWTRSPRPRPRLEKERKKEKAKLSWYRRINTTWAALSSLDFCLDVYFRSCSHVRETMLRRFSDPCVLVMTHAAYGKKREVTSQQNFTRLIFHSRLRSWDMKQKRRSQKRTLSFKLSVRLSARDAFQNSTRQSEKKFRIPSSQRTKCLMCYEIQCNSKVGGVFAEVMLGPSLLTFSCTVGHPLTKTQRAWNAHLTDNWLLFGISETCHNTLDYCSAHAVLKGTAQYICSSLI